MKTRLRTLSIILIITLAAGLLSAPHGSISAAAGLPGSPASCITYVNAAALGANNGLSWTNAYKSLQDGINASAAGCQVWVAKGTYNPSGVSRLNSFYLKNGVAIYGGFLGNESGLLQRNWYSNETILSGDIGNLNDSSDNNENVVFVDANINSTTVLDGFTIEGGNANSSHVNGGGVYIYHSSPTLTNLIIQNNNASENGGGVYISGGNPALSYVYIQNNTANNGAGLYLTNVNNTTLALVLIQDNTAATDGGGLFDDSTSTGLTIIDIIFQGNHAGSSGGGAYFAASAPALTNVIFAHNQSAAFGGGISDYQSSPTLTNVTLFQNTSAAGGGIYDSTNSQPVVRNSILWGDTGGEIYNDSAYADSTVTYSLAQGCKPAGGTWNSAVCGTDGGNNLTDSDPKFYDPANTDLHLKAGSPAINRGNNAFVIGVTTDLEGVARIFGRVVDLGAFEWPFEFAFFPVIKK